MLGCQEGSVVKVREVNKVKCKIDYEDKLKHRWERICGMIVKVEERG